MNINRNLSAIWANRSQFLSDHKQVVVNMAGAKIAIRPWSYDLFVIGEVFWEEVYAMHLAIIPELPVVVDLGANIGSFSLWAALRWNPVKIVAVEMDEDNYTLLGENIRLNGLSNKVTPVKAAIWDHNGRVGVKRHAFNHGMNEVCHEEDLGETPAVTMEKLMELAGIKKIDVLKMDIEGAEEKVISQENEDLFATSVGKLIAELHPTKGVCVERIILLLEKAGFEVQRRRQLWRSTVILEAVNRNLD